MSAQVAVRRAVPRLIEATNSMDKREPETDMEPGALPERFISTRTRRVRAAFHPPYLSLKHLDIGQ